VRRPGLSGVPWIVLAIVAAATSRHAAQVIVPPGASIDVQVAAAPAPVMIGGRPHLVYELHITNFRTVGLTLTRIDVLGEANDAALASYRDAELARGLARAGAPRSDTSDKRTIASGARAVFFIWLPLDRPAPATLRHRIAYHVLAPAGAEAGAVVGAPVDVRREPPLVLDPPLRGGPWIAIYDPASIGGHRRALFAIDGKARIPARFAIDWIKLDDAGRMSNGEAAVLSNWAGYGEEVLAVTDAVVADVVSNLPEPTRPITLENAAGNAVTLDLGGGRFVAYEHLKPGSVRVERGDRVRRGQVIAAVGGSGSVSSGPHLHFHVGDAKSALGAEGLPYVFARFEVAGAYESIEALGRAAPALQPPGRGRVVRMELPQQQTVLRF
jgi:murein DD-endopeptidase